MGESWSDILKKAKEKDGCHIYYPFPDENQYLQDTLAFMEASLASDCQIIVLENERNMLFLEKAMMHAANRNIIFINNYDFYFSNGSFHPNAITESFAGLIDQAKEDGTTVCTWGHVEWGNISDFADTLTEYERSVDGVIRNKGIVSVCAYNKEKLTQEIHDSLLECHQYILEEDGILPLNEHSNVNK